MTKYRLKKDTPAFRSGYTFETDPEDEGVLLDKEGIGAFYENEIDNFDEWFEEVSDEWPQKDDAFWSISFYGTSFTDIWGYNDYDKESMAIGNVFKTKEAAERYRDYLKAIATIRQDEGVLTPEQINERIKNEDLAYYVGYMGNRSNGEVLCGCTMSFDDCWPPVGVILFDTDEHAQASLDRHRDEWKIIANYDWSKE